MLDDDIIFGTNAGIVWRALDSNNSLTKNQLIEKTQLKDNEFFQAIGWLARENKIKKNGEFYQLDQTNLSEKIEKNVEIIYKIFNNGKLNIRRLSNITKMNEEEFHLALGWLAREGKLSNLDLIKKLELKSNNIEIEKLKYEIDTLNHNLKIRNLIINKITDQLITNQFNCTFVSKDPLPHAICGISIKNLK